MDINITEISNDVMKNINIEEMVEKKIKTSVKRYINSELYCDTTYRGDLEYGEEWGRTVKPIIDKELEKLVENNIERLVEKTFETRINKIIKDVIDSRKFTDILIDSMQSEVSKYLKRKLKA